MTDPTTDETTAETTAETDARFTVQAGTITASNVPDGDYAVGTAKVRVTNGVPVVVDGDLAAAGDYAATAYADLAGQPAPGPISEPAPADLEHQAAAEQAAAEQQHAADPMAEPDGEHTAP